MESSDDIFRIFSRNINGFSKFIKIIVRIINVIKSCLEFGRTDMANFRLLCVRPFVRPSVRLLPVILLKYRKRFHLRYDHFFFRKNQSIRQIKSDFKDLYRFDRFNEIFLHKKKIKNLTDNWTESSSL